MADYNYKAREQNGEIIEGTISAPDENIAVEILHSKSYVVLSLEQKREGIFVSDIEQVFSKPNTKDVVLFTRQLSTLVDADMPLSEGLRTLAKQMEKPAFKNVISEISEAVESGSSLSNALSKYK